MHFTVEAQKLAKPYLKPHSIAIDATAGNGFDTLFMADSIGDNGLVYAFDIQPAAIGVVQSKLDQAGLSHRCKLVADSHSNLLAHVLAEHLSKVDLVMFNLGYLPLGDKSIVTKAETTLLALDQAHEVLAVGGCLSLLAYVGHSGGQEEGRQVSEWIAKHERFYAIQCYRDETNPNSPILWSMERKGFMRSAS